MLTITEELILKAKNYLPLREKEEIAALIAENSLETVKVNVDDGRDVRPIPSMTREDFSKKARFLMGVLVGKYLHSLPDGGKNLLLSEADYDEFAASHIFDQMEKMKRTSGIPQEVKTKIYEILSDYREVEKRVNAGIYSLINIQNDVCLRLILMIDAQVTPKTLKSAGTALAETKAALEKFAAAKEEKTNG